MCDRSSYRVVDLLRRCVVQNIIWFPKAQREIYSIFCVCDTLHVCERACTVCVREHAVCVCVFGRNTHIRERSRSFAFAHTLSLSLLRRGARARGSLCLCRCARAAYPCCGSLCFIWKHAPRARAVIKAKTISYIISNVQVMCHPKHWNDVWWLRVGHKDLQQCFWCSLVPSYSGTRAGAHTRTQALMCLNVWDECACARVMKYVQCETWLRAIASSSGVCVRARTALKL